MDVSATERDDLRRSVRDFAASRPLADAVRRVVEGEAAYDQAAWDTLATTMGLTAIGIPQEYGGAGYSVAELGIVAEELGRSLAPVPFLSSAVLATSALVCCADDAAKAQYLPGLADGGAIATVALGGFTSWPFPDRTAINASATDHGHRLAGTAGHVLDAGAAGLLLAVAGLEDGWGLFAVDPASPRVVLRRHEALDLTRPLYSADFDEAEAVLLGRGPADWPGLADLASRISAALACEQAGGMASCLETTVAYLSSRAQFGRPIGSFQAIKHRCADLLVELEAARSVAYEARDRAANGLPGRPGVVAAAAAAQSWCGDAYVHAAQEAVQLHGAIGFTWEHDVHLHLRRARADQLLFGTPRAHRRALADSMGI